MPAENTFSTLPLVDLSIVLPCYNEADVIEEGVRRWCEAAEGVVERFEILLINDGSIDGTARVLDKLRRENPRVRVVHQLNIGYVRALRRGIETARGQYVLQATARGYLEREDFQSLWSAKRGRRAVLVTRVQRTEWWPRQALSMALRRAVSLFFGFEIQDANTPVRLYFRPYLAELLPRCSPDSEAINLFLTLLLKTQGTEDVIELPCPYRYFARKNPDRLGNMISRSLTLFLELLQFRFSTWMPRLTPSAAGN